MKKKRIAVIVGTRPEAIKLAPVIQLLKKSKELEPLTVCTLQHQQMTRQIFNSFHIKPQFELHVMRPRQDLAGLSARLAQALGKFLDRERVDAVLVQGDTTSALFGGLSAFYHQIPVGHVEAGLRSGNIYSPFPEEMNRSLLGKLAAWHFAPTKEASRRLRQENVPSRSIFVTGNTVVDALHWMIRHINKNIFYQIIGRVNPAKKVVLVTCHRRESFGAPMKAIAEAIATLAKENQNLVILFPLHPNPHVREVMIPILKVHPNIRLTEPLDYIPFLACLKHAWLVLSDSGGVQEEATALGKPVLVLRNVTERGEGVQAGALKLVGTNKTRILQEARRLLHDRKAYLRMTRASTVFGDGHAARRILEVLKKEL